MCDSEQLSSSVVNNTQENKSTSNLFIYEQMMIINEFW